MKFSSVWIFLEGGPINPLVRQSKETSFVTNRKVMHEASNSISFWAALLLSYYYRMSRRFFFQPIINDAAVLWKHWTSFPYWNYKLFMSWEAQVEPEPLKLKCTSKIMVISMQTEASLKMVRNLRMNFLSKNWSYSEESRPKITSSSLEQRKFFCAQIPFFERS